MPTFIYNAKDKQGNHHKGQVEAENEHAAIKTVREKGLLIIDIGPKKKEILRFRFGSKVPLKEKMIFIRQLAMMVKSSVPLVDALNLLGEQTSSKTLSKITSEVSAKVKGGETLSVALSNYPDIFPRLYINMIKSGERSGKLDQVLFRIADQMQKDYELISRVRGAMMYPALVLIVLVAVMIISIVVIIPQLEKLFAEVDVKLPVMTRTLIGLSHFIRNYYIYILIVLVIIFIVYWKFHRSPRISITLDSVKLRIPIAGILLKKIYMARFSRTMGTLIGAGLPMLETISTSKDVINNVVYSTELKKVYTEVENGKTLSKALKQNTEFPPMVYQLVSVGEASGNLDYIFFQLADFYDKEVEATTRALSTMLEPILMIIMGIGVAIMVMSVLQPIYGLVNVI